MSEELDKIKRAENILHNLMFDDAERVRPSTREEFIRQVKRAFDLIRDFRDKDYGNLRLRLTMDQDAELAARDAEIVALREALNLCKFDSLNMNTYDLKFICDVMERSEAATKAAVNRVRADAIMEAIQQDFDTVCDTVCDSVSREYIAGIADGIEQYEKHLEEYANKLRNPNQDNSEE